MHPRHLLYAVLLSSLFALGIHAQTVDSRNPATGKGIIFKIPDNVFPMDWNKSGFIGILMLEKDSPSGVFAVYPNNGGETIADLRERAARFIVPMFTGGGGDEKNKQKKELTFKTFPIPNNKGDTGASGLYYLFENEQALVQILFYEREGDVKNMLYGYFARKSKNDKSDKVNGWADDKGQGV